jgi:glycosyltransferase involved in cell wall biosynthesis
MVLLNDDELQAAYSGAIALAYPSRYEGFGLPVLEAMACSCPAITCRNSSIPEVGGEAVVYVDPDSVEQMHQALLEVQQPAVRQRLVALGLAQAQQFSWTQMARAFGTQLAQWALAPHAAERS